MKVTMNEIVGTDPALARLMNAEDVPAKQQFGILMLVAKLKDSMEAFGKVRSEIGKRLAEGEDILPQEKIPEFNRLLRPILEAEHEIDFTPPEVSASKIVTAADKQNLYHGILVNVIDVPKDLKEVWDAQKDEAEAEEPTDEEIADGEAGTDD